MEGSIFIPSPPSPSPYLAVAKKSEMNHELKSNRSIMRISWLFASIILVLQRQVDVVTSFTLPSISSSSSLVSKSRSFKKANVGFPFEFTTTAFMSNNDDDNENEKTKLVESKTTSTTATSTQTETSTRITTSEAEQLKLLAKQTKLEAEKMQAELTLEKIKKLEQKIQSLSSADKQKRAKDLKIEIETLVKNFNPDLLPSLPISKYVFEEEEEVKSIETNLYKSKTDAMNAAAATATTSPNESSVETNLYKNRVPPKPMISESDLSVAAEYYESLPKVMKKTLADAIDLDDERISASLIVLGLYEFVGTETLSETRLQRLYKENNSVANAVSVLERLKIKERAKMNNDDLGLDSMSGGVPSFNNLIEDANKVETMVESLLPRVTRKEGLEPTLQDINVLKTNKIVGKETFALSSPPQNIPGGFILRGEMVNTLRGDCDKLVRLLDERIDSSTSMPEDWNEKFQINVMNDPTPKIFENDESLDGDIVLVVHSRDMKPTTNQFLLSAVSTLSLFLTFIFTIATYSQNEIVMDRLTSANAIGDFDLTWFNQLITPLLLSIGLTQACHEAGHLFIAKKDGFKITPPTILPLMALPFLSFKQSIKTSPKNFDSLFNFGMIGPAIGMIVSSIFFAIGLQLTLTMDASALEYAPSVPVLFLKFSSLGGSVVDSVIGGGQGIITQQDPFTPVKLHPFAIGGLASLMINCLDTIPLPGTDGGRMSQSLLGRSGQVAFGGVIYFALLVYTAFSGHREIFLSFLAINSIARQDNEIPCRNEVDKAGLGQATIALLMWSVAILALTPMD